MGGGGLPPAAGGVGTVACGNPGDEGRGGMMPQNRPCERCRYFDVEIIRGVGLYVCALDNSIIKPDTTCNVWTEAGRRQDD
jgi:hypothetical protein